MLFVEFFAVFFFVLFCKRKERGWHLIGYNEAYDEKTNPDAADEWPVEPPRKDEESDIMYNIVEYYKNNPDPNISIVYKDDA